MTHAADKLTDAQKTAWKDAIDEINQYEIYDVPADPYDSLWNITLQPESRVGRGHSIVATCINDLYIAQIHMDVYGYPLVFVGSIEVIHNSADENCECDPCTEERESE